MKNIVMCIVLLSVSIFCYSQTKYDNFDKLILEADSLKTAMKYNEALKKYIQALDILTPSYGTSYFDAAMCAYELNNEDLTKKLIIRGISEGSATLEYLKEYEGFNKIQEKSFYNQIILNYNIYRKEYFSSIKNIDIYLEIEELIQRDQFVRNLNDYLIGRTEKDIENAYNALINAQKMNDTIAIKKYKKLLFPEPIKEYEQVFMNLMRKVDSLNIDRLIEITKEYGWQEKAFLLLWHQRGDYNNDYYVWNYFKPLINKEIEEGKISRSFWKPFDEFQKQRLNKIIVVE